MTSSETLTLTTPRRNLIIPIIACGACLALGLWFIDQPLEIELAIWSAAGILILAIAIILGLLQLREPVRLILTQEGFTLTGSIGVSIPWCEVEEFLVYSEDKDEDGNGGVAPHASWRLKDGAPSVAGKIASLHRKGNMPVDGSLPRNIGMTPYSLAELMEEWRQRYAPDPD